MNDAAAPDAAEPVYVRPDGPFNLGVTASDGTQLEAEAQWPAMGPDVATEALWPAAANADGTPTGVPAVVVLSHPHPLYGGDMWNPLIDHLFRALPAAGLAVLRYNFRGVGNSEGRHDDGKAERLDAEAAFRAAHDHVLDRETKSSGDRRSAPAYPVNVVSAGWSFGGDVSLAAKDKNLTAWVGIAAPLRIVDPAEMAAAADPRPKLLLAPEHDEFRPPAEAAEIAHGWPNTEVETIRGGDHFLGGHAATVAERIVAFVRRLPEVALDR